MSWGCGDGTTLRHVVPRGAAWRQADVPLVAPDSGARLLDYHTCTVHVKESSQGRSFDQIGFVSVGEDRYLATRNGALMAALVNNHDVTITWIGSRSEAEYSVQHVDEEPQYTRVRMAAIEKYGMYKRERRYFSLTPK
jgi:hypothetical protein